MPIITDTYITKLKKPNGKPVEYFDDRLPSFAVRKGKKGKVVFLIDYQLSKFDVKTGKRHVKRFRKAFAQWEPNSPIPNQDLLNADMARDRAEDYKRLAKRNIDPFHQIASTEIDIRTVAELMEAYFARHVEVHCRKNTQDGVRIRFNTHIKPQLGSMPLQELKTLHIQQFHAETSKEKPWGKKRKRGGPVAANQSLADLKAALNKAVEWELLLVNPALKIKKIKQYERRRYLDAEEIKRLLNAMTVLEEDKTWAYKYKSCNDAVRMALFTGCRKGELLATQWKDVDLKSSPPVWSKPHETTKQKDWEIVPLSTECVEVLKQRKIENNERDIPSPYVFPMHGIPEKHMLDIKSAWKTLRDKANIKDFTFHDLRHTFASHMAIQGKSLYIIGKMLGHKDTQTTQRYAKLNTGALEDLANSMSAVVQAAVQVPVPANDNN